MENAARSRRFVTIAGLFLALAGTSSFAQSAMDSVPTMDVVSRKLELTPEQETRLRAIFDARLAELQQTRATLEKTTSRAEKRQALQAAKQQGNAFNASVEGVLTPSQIPKWRELRAETREKVKQRYDDKHE